MTVDAVGAATSVADVMTVRLVTVAPDESLLAAGACRSFDARIVAGALHRPRSRSGRHT